MKDISAAIEIAIQNHKSFNIPTKEDEEPGLLNQESLFVKSNSRIVRININEVLYVEAKGDYSLFKTVQKGYIVSSPFKKVEENLPISKFIKVHRSYIVNVDKIVDIEENNLLIENQVIPVSRSQKGNLVKRLKLI